MTMKYQFGQFVQGVLIDERTVVWPKGDSTPGEKPYPREDKNVKISKIRTDKNDVIELVHMPLSGVLGKLKLGDSVSLTMDEPHYRIEGGKLTQVFGKGAICAPRDAFKIQTPSAAIVRPGVEMTHRERAKTNMDIRSGIWSQFKGRIDLRFANCLEVGFQDDSAVIDWVDRIDISKPSPKAVTAALAIGSYHWGNVVNLRGSESFLMAACQLSTDLKIKVENYSIENAQVGLKPQGLVPAQA